MPFHSTLANGLILGLMGQARTGKDTFANRIIKKYHFVRIGMADPLKRFCKEVFDFNDEQLWGDERDLPDKRYIRKENVNITELEDSRFMKHIEAVIDGKSIAEPSVENCRLEYLTPRYALQTLGTEWGRDCYPAIWTEYGLRIAKELVNGYARYTAKKGLEYVEKDVGDIGVVFSDIRFRNEFDAIKKAGGKVVRITRPLAPGTKGIANHPSEMEQLSIPDSEFDWIMHNDVDGLDAYHKAIDVMMEKCILV
jgi:hypothetical protein